MHCNFTIDENKIARCSHCGFTFKTVQKDPARIHRKCTPITKQVIEAPVVKKSKLVSEKATRKPGFLAKLTNFSKAAISHIVKGSPSCTQEQIDTRLAICKECPLFQIASNNPDVGSCNACGCNINKENKFLNKLAWADQECPKGKWGRLDTPKEGEENLNKG